MSRRVMVVDDEPHILEVIRVSLEDFGFEIIDASDGEQVVSMALESRPDLILLDVMLPGKDGFQVCSELKAQAETAAIPVVLLTAKSSAEDHQAGRECGADAFVSKPFSPLSLLSIIHQHLNLGIVPS